MTRINIIKVQSLYDQHLLAEHRELKRIPNCIKSGRYNLKGQPLEYTLGTGHVKFFYNKLTFLKERYIELYKECKKRGFNVENYIDCFEGIDNKELWNDYTPTEQAKEINLKRIQEKFNLKPNYYTYRGIKILLETS